MNLQQELMGVSEGYIACRACSHACSRVHNNGRKGSSVLFPCFVKTVSDHAANTRQCSCRMRLPAAFRNTYLPNVKNQSMIIEGPSGCEWPVIYRGGEFYSGWKSFSQDHGLTPGDLLYFTLIEDFRFRVQVFDKSGCETASSFLVANNDEYHDNRSRRKQEAKKTKRVTDLVSAARGLTSKRANNAGSSQARQEDAPFSSKKFKENEGNLTSYMPASKQSIFEHAKYAFPTKNHRSFEHQFLKGTVTADGEKLGVDKLEEIFLRSLGRSHKRKSDNLELASRKKRSKLMPRGNTPTTTVKYWGSEKTSPSGIKNTRSLKEKRAYLRQSQVPKWRQTQAQIRARAVIERAKSRKVRLNKVFKIRELTPQVPAPTDTDEDNSDDHDKGSSDGAANSSLDGRSTSSSGPSFPDVGRETKKEHEYGNSNGSEEREGIALAGLTRLLRPDGTSSRSVYQKNLAALRTEQKSFQNKLRRPQKQKGESVSHPTESHVTFTRTTKAPVLKSWKRDKDYDWISNVKRSGPSTKRTSEAQSESNQNIPVVGFRRQPVGISVNRVQNHNWMSSVERKGPSQEKPGASQGQFGHINLNTPNVALRRKPGRPRKHPLNDSVKQLEATASPYFRKNLDSLGGEKPKSDGPVRRRAGRPFKCASLGRTDLLEPKWRDVFISQRRPVNDSERGNALAAAREFSAGMKEISIVVVMRPSFVYRNFVVGLTAKAAELMPQQTMDVRLCNSDWKAWSCAWNPKYHYFCGRGWRNFALEHCLEADDACVFQVIACTEDVLILNVHIFRVVAIPAGQTAWHSHTCPRGSFPDADTGLTIERKYRPSRQVSLVSHGNRKDKQAERSTESERDIESSTLEQRAKTSDAVHRKWRDSPSVSTAIAISSGSLQAPRKKAKRGVKADFEESDGKSRNYNKVVRLHDRKKMHNKPMFLVELEGPVLNDMKNPVCERNADGFWWVPQNNFTMDFLRCHIN